MRRPRLREVNDSSKVTRVAKNQLLVFCQKGQFCFCYTLLLPRRLRDGRKVRDKNKLW